MFSEHFLKTLDRVSGRGNADQVFKSCHDLRDWNIWKRRVVFVVQKWIAIEVNPGLVDTSLAECIANPFAEHHSDHDG